MGTKAIAKLHDNHPRDTCADCGEVASNFTGAVMITIEDRIGERVVCSRCWRRMSSQGVVR